MRTIALPVLSALPELFQSRAYLHLETKKKYIITAIPGQ
jgi:hypothetical protein